MQIQLYFLLIHFFLFVLFSSSKQIEKTNQGTIKKPMAKAYEHPFNSVHHPLNFSAVKIAETFHDFVGPEQVSPHYENFTMSRKMLLSKIHKLG